MKIYLHTIVFKEDHHYTLGQNVMVILWLYSTYLIVFLLAITLSLS